MAKIHRGITALEKEHMYRGEPCTAFRERAKMRAAIEALPPNLRATLWFAVQPNPSPYGQTMIDVINHVMDKRYARLNQE
jgi:hypothetical protein